MFDKFLDMKPIEGSCRTQQFCLVLVALLISVGFQRAARAASTEDHFDGSEFNGSTFRDKSFDKHAYNESATVHAEEKIESARGHVERGNAKKHLNAKELEQKGETANSTLGITKNYERQAEELGPVHDLPSDWVPNSVDLTSNGGFTIAPMNGSPVPYTLNGHPDIQRGRP